MSAVAPSSRTPKFRAFFRRYGWVLPAVGLTLLLRWRLQQGESERLTALSGPQLLAVRDGQAFVLLQKASYIVEAQPIQGGTPRQLCTLPNTTLGHRVYGDALYYLLPEKRDCTLKILSLAGGKTAETNRSPTLMSALDYRFFLCEDTVYWRSYGIPKTKASSSAKPDKPPRFQEGLMALPLTGGEPRRIVGEREIKGGPTFFEGQYGVFWYKWDARKRNALYYWRKDRQYIFPDFGGTEAPVEADNRLYWIEKSEIAINLLEMHAKYGGPPPPARGTLVSVNLDGTERRTVEGVNLDEGGFTGQLTVYRDRLYLWKSPYAPQTGLSGNSTEGGLWRLKKDGSKLERLFTPPKGAGRFFCFDQDYFYFVREEPQEGWFAWIESQPTSTYTLYRYRLPD